MTSELNHLLIVQMGVIWRLEFLTNHGHDEIYRDRHSSWSSNPRPSIHPRSELTLTHPQLTRCWVLLNHLISTIRHDSVISYSIQEDDRNVIQIIKCWWPRSSTCRKWLSFSKARCWDVRENHWIRLTFIPSLIIKTITLAHHHHLNLNHWLLIIKHPSQSMNLNLKLRSNQNRFMTLTSWMITKKNIHQDFIHLVYKHSWDLIISFDLHPHCLLNSQKGSSLNLVLQSHFIGH